MRPSLRASAIGLVVGLHAALLYGLVQPHHALPGHPGPAWDGAPVWVSGTAVPAAPTHDSGQAAKRIEEGPTRQDTPAEGGPSPSAEPAYVDADRLDRKAEPVGEWLVDASAWPRTPKTVQVELWVSDQGLIERWRFLNLPQPSAQLLQFLQPLAHTPMNPGWRQGRPVPSRLRIELLLDA